MSETDTVSDKLREFVAVLEFGELFPPAKFDEPPPNLGPMWAASRQAHHADSD